MIAEGVPSLLLVVPPYVVGKSLLVVDAVVVNTSVVGIDDSPILTLDAPDIDVLVVRLSPAAALLVTLLYPCA